MGSSWDSIWNGTFSGNQPTTGTSWDSVWDGTFKNPPTPAAPQSPTLEPGPGTMAMPAPPDWAAFYANPAAPENSGGTVNVGSAMSNAPEGWSQQNMRSFLDNPQPSASSMLQLGVDIAKNGTQSSPWDSVWNGTLGSSQPSQATSQPSLADEWKRLSAENATGSSAQGLSVGNTTAPAGGGFDYAAAAKKAAADAQADAIKRAQDEARAEAARQGAAQFDYGGAAARAAAKAQADAKAQAEEAARIERERQEAYDNRYKAQDEARAQTAQAPPNNSMTDIWGRIRAQAPGGAQSAATDQTLADTQAEVARRRIEDQRSYAAGVTGDALKIMNDQMKRMAPTTPTSPTPSAAGSMPTTPSAQMAMLNAPGLSMDPTLPGQAELVGPEVNSRLSASTSSSNLYKALNENGTVASLTSGGPGAPTIGRGVTGLESVASRTSPGQTAAGNAVAGSFGIATDGVGRQAYDAATGTYTSPLASEQNYGTLDATRNAPSALDTYYAQNQGALSGPGAVGRAYGDVRSQIGNADALDAAYNLKQEALFGQGFTNKLASGYSPTTGYAEDLYTGGQGSSGLDKYYNTMIDRGTRNLGEAAAARGSFNSGAGIRAVEELNRDMSAQQAKDYIDLSTKADASRELQRQYGLALATAGDRATLDQANAALSAAGSADKTALERAAQSLEAAKTKESETENRFKLSSDLATGVTAADLARENSLTRAAADASQSALGRATQGTAAGVAVDKSALDAYNTAGTIGLAGEAGIRAANDSLVNAGKAQSDVLNTGVATAGDLAIRSDTTETTRAAAQMAAASVASAAREGRISAQLGREVHMAISAATAVMAQLSAADKEALDAVMGEIESALNEEGVDAAATMAKIQAANEKLGQIIKVSGMATGTKV